MIGLVRSVLGLAGGKWLLGGSIAIILGLSGWLAVEKWQHAGTKNDLTAMTSLRKEERSNHRQTKAYYRAAMAQAKLNQAAAIADREAQWRNQSNATETKIRTELGSALAAADAYVARLRTAAKAGAGDTGGTIETQTAGAAPIATQPFGPGGMPQLDGNDVRICTVNTVEYRQLKALYEQLRAESQKPAVP
jgi:hypothetical protein